MTPRRKPRLGDALIINYTARQAAYTAMAIADCECGEATYTAVSSTLANARKLIYRKHVRHLVTCKRQAELFALDGSKLFTLDGST
jgi:hypothetical protein